MALMTDLSDNLTAEVGRFEGRLASLEAASGKTKVWYRDPATLIAAAAFLVSFGTTIDSIRRSNAQDIHGLRVELRGMLEKLVLLPRENAEAFIKFKDDPNLAGQLSGYFSQENLMFAQQADGIVNRLPTDQVSSADYLTIAQALILCRSYQQAIGDLHRAVERAVLLDEKVSALRTLGYVEMNLGQIAAGRVHFENAVEVFTDLPGRYDDYTIRSTTMQTQVNWAGAELAIGNHAGALQHMDLADQAVEPLAPGPGKSLLESQLRQSRSFLTQANNQESNAAGNHPSALIPQSLSPGAASKL